MWKPCAVLSEINATVLSDKGKALVQQHFRHGGYRSLHELYASGQSSYDSGDYAAAVDSLKQIIDVDDTLVTMAAPCICMPVHCTEAATQITAAQMYQKVIDNYGGTKNATDSQRYLEEIQAQ